MNFLSFLISLSALMLLAYGPWQAAMEDWARQRLFEVRDRIFDMARAGRISFDDKRYIATRHALNSMIRFVHEITWVRMLYISIIRIWMPVHESEKLGMKEAVEAIEDPVLAKELRREFAIAGTTLGMLMILRSPFLVLLLVPMVTLALAVAIIYFVCEAFVRTVTKTLQEGILATLNFISIFFWISCSAYFRTKQLLMRQGELRLYALEPEAEANDWNVGRKFAGA